MLHGLRFIKIVIWVMNNMSTKMNERTLNNVGNYGNLDCMGSFRNKSKLRNMANISKQKDR